MQRIYSDKTSTSVFFMNTVQFYFYLMDAVFLPLNIEHSQALYVMFEEFQNC